MSQNLSRLRGLRTVVYYVEDLSSARDWYEGWLGIKPYFDEPFYVGFNVGGFELGLHPAQEEGHDDRRAGSVAYWGVENIEDTVIQLKQLGASTLKDIENVGGRIRVAECQDPFGNVIGVIENPDFPNTLPNEPAES